MRYLQGPNKSLNYGKIGWKQELSLSELYAMDRADGFAQVIAKMSFCLQIEKQALYLCWSIAKVYVNGN